jgi:hypothetical protein
MQTGFYDESGEFTRVTSAGIGIVFIPKIW